MERERRGGKEDQEGFKMCYIHETTLQKEVNLMCFKYNKNEQRLSR